MSSLSVAPAAPAVVVRSVVTKFGQHVVHDGVSFSVPRGQVVALIGGSGSGKSVLLKEMIGLLKPTAGGIEVLGVETTSAPREELQQVYNRCGVLFQNGALFSAINVADNVAVPLREQTELPEPLISEIVRLRLALSGLPLSAAQKMPSELSGGMRKRAALARALALEPELLFLDEPTSGLDPINARAFDRLIRTLCDVLGLTILLVTHDLDTLRGIVDTVVALGKGRVIAQGSVREVASSDHPWLHAYFHARG